jgi:hypothetical protein
MKIGPKPSRLLRYKSLFWNSFILSALAVLCRSVIADQNIEGESEISAEPRAANWNDKEILTRPIHTSWGAEDYSNDFSRSPPAGVPLSISASYLKEAFGVKEVHDIGLLTYPSNSGRC